MHKGVGFALLFSSFFSIYPMKMKQFPNYFIFIGCLKTGAGRGFERTPEPPLDPPLGFR